MKKTTSKKSLSPIDRCHGYALDVTAGKIVAGPHVRASCQRFLDDLKHGKARELHYDAAATARVFAFFEQVLCLTGGKFEGEPFLLHPSQCFILGNIFGWKRADGKRRFRRVYMEIGKGNGKTPLIAGIGLYGMLADGEARAEIYAAAAKKEQAMILFRDARNMVNLSAPLTKACHISGGDTQPNLAHLKSGSFFRVMSSEKSKSGFRPSMALCDEVHEHPNGETIAMLARGFKGRDNPLLCMITNSGFDKKSICWEEHSHAVKVAHQDLTDDTTFSFVCSLDEGDDPLTDPSCWIKANPLLDVIISHEQMELIAHEARVMPGKRNNIMRLHFCQWTDADSAWISGETWRACEHDELSREAVQDFPCYGGLDLSRTTDLSALASLYEHPDGTLDVFMDFWLPEDNLKEAEDRDRAPYLEWRRMGFLNAPPGRSIGLDWVFEHISTLHDGTPFLKMGYDRFRKGEMDAEIIRQGFDGFPMVEVGQGFVSMSPPLAKLEELIITGKIRFKTHPILRWNAQSVAVECDAAGNRKFTKRKSTGRIDGLAAVLNAISVWMNDVSKEETSVYETRGFISFDF